LLFFSTYEFINYSNILEVGFIMETNIDSSKKIQLFMPPQETLELSVIVPTRNESGNVENLLRSLQKAFNQTPVEVIFVDDSSDDTPQVVDNAVNKFPSLNVKLIHRIPTQRTGGLGGAVIAGLKVAQAEFACIMDGDLQHPPELVPVLLRTAIEKNADMVVATRRSKESHVAGLSVVRDLISRGLDLTARIFFPKQLRGVSDPLTGFFLVKVNAIKIDELRPNGFKILLDILVRNPSLRKAEVPFEFGERLSGESKASAAEVWKYLNLLWTLRFGKGIMRFTGFALVGLSGVLVNSLALYLVTDQLNIFYLYSTLIATVVSTLWNFTFTETLVYKSERRTNRISYRLGMFLLLNILALALRTPIIYLFTEVLGMYYLISNLVSLAILSIIRFVLADNFIWTKSNQISEPIFTKSKEGIRMMKKNYSYNIHNIVTVVSEGRLPELEPFQTHLQIPTPTISVQFGTPPSEKETKESDHKYMNYREIFGRLGFEVGITMVGDDVKVTASPSLRYSPHVLYTNVVEPILRWTFVKKGYALVHCATIAFGDEAYMITARTDTGKTTTLLKILSHQRRDSDQAAFISDDMTLVSPEGLAMTYPKPMTISFHTLRAVNSKTLSFREKLILPFQSRVHSREGRKAAFLISKSKLPAATINLVVQALIPPPKYYVQKLIPKAKLATKAHLAGMFIIERGEGDNQPMNTNEAIEILFKNCEDAYGFPPYDELKEFLYCDEGYDLRDKEHAIIRQAIGSLPTTLIRSENMDWWCKIPPFVDEQVANDCACDSPAPSFVGNRRLVGAE
jgi:glycosyltransferase involved in cell wall biosynthesis